MTITVVTSALELGFIYSLVALALFLSFRILNIADMTTDGSFTLGYYLNSLQDTQGLRIFPPVA